MGMALSRLSWGRSQAEQDRAAGAGECGQGRLPLHEPRSHPGSFGSSRLGAPVCPAPL